MRNRWFSFYLDKQINRGFIYLLTKHLWISYYYLFSIFLFFPLKVKENRLWYWLAMLPLKLYLHIHQIHYLLLLIFLYKGNLYASSLIHLKVFHIAQSLCSFMKLSGPLTQGYIWHPLTYFSFSLYFL
jgi:hypothetical protein